MVKGQVRHGEVWDLNHSVNDGAVVVLGGGGGVECKSGQGKVKAWHVWCNNPKLVLPGGFVGGSGWGEIRI